MRRNTCRNLERYIDDHQDEYVKRLADVVAIKSVSGWPDHRQEVIKMVENCAEVDLREGKGLRGRAGMGG